MIVRLRIKVQAKAKENSLKRESDGSWKAKVTAAPTGNKANERVIELVAQEFKTAKSNVSIFQGLRNKEKIIDISL